MNQSLGLGLGPQSLGLGLGLVDPSLDYITDYNTLLPAVIECKPGPAVITRPTKYTLLKF